MPHNPHIMTGGYEDDEDSKYPFPPAFAVSRLLTAQCHFSLMVDQCICPSAVSLKFMPLKTGFINFCRDIQISDDDETGDEEASRPR